jgi:hypothetical protein
MINYDLAVKFFSNFEFNNSNFLIVQPWVIGY